MDEGNTRDLAISNGLVVPNVSADVEVSRGKVERETTSVCSFHEVGDDLFRIFDAGLLGFFIVCSCGCDWADKLRSGCLLFFFGLWVVLD